MARKKETKSIYNPEIGENTKTVAWHPSEKVEYYDDDPNHGIIYDWDKIKKRYEDLKCPEEYFSPVHVPFNLCRWYMGYSARSVGKSTGWFLLCMIMNTMYGTRMIYVRQSEDNIKPKYAEEMFNAVLANGYVYKITKGRWNSLWYNARKWYFANVDPDGTIEEKAIEPFCHVISVDRGQNVKSVGNFPTGDMIIYDEFINKYYHPDEFVWFCDLFKTIQRDRFGCHVVLLGNNTDVSNQWFAETETMYAAYKLKPGEHTIQTTRKGTNIFVEYIGFDKKRSAMLEMFTKLYYGFENEKLGAITGEGWALEPAHILPHGDFRIAVNNLFVKSKFRHLKLDIGVHENIGLACNVHFYSKIDVLDDGTLYELKEPYGKKIILTTEPIQDREHVYGRGTGKLAELINKLIKENRMYFSDNLAQAEFFSYWDNAKNF